MVWGLADHGGGGAGAAGGGGGGWGGGGVAKLSLTFLKVIGFRV